MAEIATLIGFCDRNKMCVCHYVIPGELQESRSSFDSTPFYLPMTMLISRQPFPVKLMIDQNQLENVEFP
jgi:hypothetical protein